MAFVLGRRALAHEKIGERKPVGQARSMAGIDMFISGGKLSIAMCVVLQTMANG